MRDLDDFIKTVITVLIAAILLYLFATGMLGRAVVYADNLFLQKMYRCQAAGYTYGECYDRLSGASSKFSK
jgi:hypothetical protein